MGNLDWKYVFTVCLHNVCISGVISNVLYENIILDAPEQWAVWIGPAQQSVSSSLCNPHPCRLMIKMVAIMVHC